MSDLAQALCQAQLAVKTVGKDGRNDYHRYNYVSAEQKIMMARLLAANGLAVIPQDFSIRYEGNQWVARREGKILHLMGESESCAIEWFVVPEKGRPLDKAVAAAHTASLGYLIRDLLMIPVVEKGQELDDPLRDELNPEYVNGPPADPPRADKKKAEAKPKKETRKAPELPEEKKDRIQLEWKADYKDFVERVGAMVRTEGDESKFDAICIVAKELGFDRPSEMERSDREKLIDAMQKELF